MNWRWFNLNPGFDLTLRLPGYRNINIKLFNCFNRHTMDGDHWWGVGLLQVNSRHLFYIGHGGISVLFIGRTA